MRKHAGVEMKSFGAWWMSGPGSVCGARRRKTVWVMVLLLLAAGRFAPAQARESATAGGASLTVGGTVSGYYLQYGEMKIVGASGFFDTDTVRRLGIEGEGRWLEYRQTNDVHVETYMIGPRYHFNMGRFQPYAKGVVGIGYFNFPYNYAHGSYLVVGMGGGADYHLNHRWSVRVADVQYQYWPQFTYGAMSSVGVSAGIRYRIF